MPGKVPDRWEDYCPMGKTIEGTRFFAFKVPLEERICRRLSSRDAWFTPVDLVEGAKANGQRLGHVVDLTFTARYYDKQCILDYGIEYDKVFTAGKEVPNKKVRKSFFKVLNRFLRRNQDNDLVLGVHCTHGVNRTGYLLCRYMIDCMGFSPDAAISAFNKARGHALERENYLEDLRDTNREEENEEEDEEDEEEEEEKEEHKLSTASGTHDKTRPQEDQWQKVGPRRRGAGFENRDADRYSNDGYRQKYSSNSHHAERWSPIHQKRGHFQGGDQRARGPQAGRTYEARSDSSRHGGGHSWPNRGHHHSVRGWGQGQGQGSGGLAQQGYYSHQSDLGAGQSMHDRNSSSRDGSSRDASRWNQRQNGYNREGQNFQSSHSSRGGYHSNPYGQRSSWGQGAQNSSQDDYGSFGRRHDHNPKTTSRTKSTRWSEGR